MLKSLAEFFRRLLDTSDFPARWHCGNWSPELGWLHVLSDAAIWAAYMTIPLAIVYYLRRRQGDFLFPRVLLLFGAFVAMCGTGHIIESTIFWYPVYRLSGLVKLLTAIISWVTVIALIRLAPAALRIPGLVKMNQELILRNRELDEYAHVVSHDLRAPLQGIATLAEWITEDNRDKLGGESLEQLELLMQRVTRIEQLIDGVLEYSRIGRVTARLDDVDARAVVEQTLELLDVPASINVTIHALPVVRYNRQHLARVFQNLLDNAIKHMGAPAGELEISCEERPTEWEFRVRDTGPGIAPEHHARIFKMFQVLRPREDGATSGVGLPIVHKIVTRHGGALTLRSTPGEGATFLFTVPRSRRARELSGADAALIERLGQ